jgi:hypothetical protein
MKSGRRSEPLIANIATELRETVCLRVAAAFLGLDERTARARIESGELFAERDGKVYAIPVSELRRYVAARRIAS